MIIYLVHRSVIWSGLGGDSPFIFYAVTAGSASGMAEQLGLFKHFYLYVISSRGVSGMAASGS